MVPRLHRSWLALASVVAVAAMVRCDRLADGSYNFDEAFCWKMTTFPIGELATRAARDNHPPLYFYALWLWARAFGDSPEALRSLSVVFGLATVVAAYALARQVERSRIRENSRAAPGVSTVSAADFPHPSRLPKGEGELTALAAAALVALSPFQVDWSQQARMGYSLGAALSVISCWLLLKALQASPPRWRDFACYAMAAAAMAYTHHFALFILAGQFLYAVGWLLLRGESFGGADGSHHPPPPLQDEYGAMSLVSPSRALALSPSPIRGQARPERRYALMALALVALLYLPWAPTFLRQRQQVSELFYTRPFEWTEVARACYQTLTVRLKGEPASAAIAWGATAACLLPAAAMLFWGRGGLRLMGLCVLVTFHGAICASIADRNIIQSRYFVFANVLLLCGLPPLVAQLPRRRTGPTHRDGNLRRVALRHGVSELLAPAALAAMVAGMSWLCLARAERRDEYVSRPGMMAAMSYLADVRQEGEPIMVSNPMVQIVAAGHGGGQDPPRVLSASASFPYFQGATVMRADEYVAPRELARSSCRRVWAIDAVNCLAGTWTVRLSDDWIDVSEEVFAERPSPRSQVVVRCYERRRPAHKDTLHASR